MTGELREAQHVLEAGLVQAHLARAEVARHGLVLDQLDAPGRQAVVDRVEDQQVVGARDDVDQVQALGAAVDQLDLRRELPALLQGLDAAHAEALVGPQHVADAQHDDARRLRCGSGAGRACRRGHGFQSLKVRWPETIVLTMLWRPTMSSRIAA